MIPPQFQNQHIKSSTNNQNVGIGGKPPVKQSRNPNLIDGTAVGLPSASNTNPTPISNNLSLNHQNITVQNSNDRNLEDGGDSIKQ